jgi:hypothetical protein
MDYLVTAITFVIFFVEAMMHYNIGINAGKKSFLFKFPKPRDFIRIIGVLAIFSCINGYIVSIFR